MSGRFLADPDEPYVTADGEVYRSNNETPEPETEITEKIVPAKKLESSQRRTIGDLPAGTPNEQIIINVVLNFHLLGLSQNEISHHLQVGINQIKKIMDSPAFQTTYDMLFGEMIEYNRTSTVAKINHAATRAVENVIGLMDDEEAPHIVRFKASETIMDRSGLSENALHGKNASKDQTDQTLHIVIDDGSSSSGININLNVGEKDGD